MIRVVRPILIAAVQMDRHPLHPRTLELVRYLEAGGSTAPIHVATTEFGYRICDGRHRITASKLLGRTHILARFVATRGACV